MIEWQQFSNAEKRLDRKVKRQPENAHIQEQLAFTAMKLHDFEKAALHYSIADNLGELSHAGLIHFGQVLIKTGQGDAAVKKFERFIKAEPESFIAQLMLRSVKRSQSWTAANQSYELRAVHDLNSSYSEFSPLVVDHGLVFITTRNIDHINESTAGYNDQPYMAAYMAPFDKNDPAGFAFNRARPFLRNLNGNFHLGPVAIDSHSNQIYFTKAEARLGKGSQSQLAIYAAPLIRQKRIGKAVQLLSGDTFSYAHPTISPNGKKLVFASNSPGSKGKMDLFITSRDSSGSWSKPVPLSENINTPLNEVFPHFQSDTALYFSSDGHEGMGGLDIFVSTFTNGKWTIPKNLRTPINSNRDDFGICFVNASKGYFSSGRTGGLGKDDIYGFVKLTELNDSNRTEITGVFEYSALPADGVTLQLLDEFNNVLATVQTDSTGKFVFSKLPEGKNYRIKLLNDDDDMQLNSSIFIVNQDGEKVVEMQRDNLATFVFKTLPKDEIARLSALDESDTKLETFDIYGQLFTELGDEAANIELFALADNGRLIASSLTDLNGYYQFINLSSGQPVLIKSKDSTIYRSTVFYADAYETREITNFSDPKLRINLGQRKGDFKQNTSGHFGFVSINGRGVPNIPVVVFDSSQRMTEVVRTNNEGKFELFSTLPNATYRLLMPDSFSQLDSAARVYLIDRTTGKVINANSVDFRSYNFQTLPPIEDLLSEEDVATYRKPLIFSGQIYKKLPGDYSSGLPILVYDQDGNLIETVYPDSSGRFSFSKLSPDQSYILKSDASDPSAFKIALFDEHGNTTQVLRLAELQNYLYNRLEEERIERLVMLNVIDRSMPNLSEFVSGQIYYTLPGDYKAGIKVYAFDDQGNIIDSAYTDGNGGFTFTRLGKTEDFSIKVMDETDRRLQMALFNYDGSFRGMLHLDGDNKFKYSKIILEAIADLSPIKETDKSSGLMYGQVYKVLPGDYHQKMMLYAFDDQGNLIDAVPIDKDGNFMFSKLKPNVDYVFQLSEDDSEFNIALMDAQGNIIDRLHVFNGKWEYSILQHDQYRLKALQEVDVKMAVAAEVEDTPIQATKVENKEGIKTDYQSNANFVLHFDYRDAVISSSDMEFVREAVSQLRKNKNLHILINSHTDPSEIKGDRSISGLRSAIIAQKLYAAGIDLERIHIVNYEAQRPQIDCSEGCNEADRKQNMRSELQLVARETMRKNPEHIVTFGFNEYALTSEAMRETNEIADLLKSDNKRSVIIDGYTDTWGSHVANMQLSERRVESLKNTLVKKGIDETRIQINTHGEMIPTGQCKLYYPCPVEERQQNRRVEVRIN